MKKLFYLFLLLGFAVVSCNKPETTLIEQDVTFKALAFESGFKSDDVCTGDVAHYALLTIQIKGNVSSSVDKTVDIFYLSGTMYTNTLKLDPGIWELTSFVLMNDGADNTRGTSDDEIVYASPVAGSLNSQIVQGLPYEFTVGVFEKNEVALEVLCFDVLHYTDFGFSWFALNFTNVGNNDLVFFGDFCTSYFAQYENSLYGSQSGGLSHDMPAIFMIDVYKNGSETPLNTYNNESWFGVGQPLIVPNQDDMTTSGDTYEFVLSIYVKIGDSFGYKEFHTWTRTDTDDLFSQGESTPFVIGDDNVIDFVLGACVPNADLVLPPYQNLPLSATVTTGGTTPGSIGTYFDITISGIGSGYDLKNISYGVYCADLLNTIQLNHTYYGMKIYSSLYAELVPNSFSVQKEVLDNINWLGNNFYRFPGHNWKDVQNAIWMMLGHIAETNTVSLGGVSQTAIDMKNSAMSIGENYLPQVGGYAAVLFIDPAATDSNPVLQLIFTLVDP